MVTIKSLESQMDAIIRSGLRDAMQYVDVMDRRDPLHEVKVFLYQSLYDPLHDQILKTHTEGYGAGGDLMRRAGMKVDWSPLGDAVSYEDPRIAKMAKAVILGLEESLDGQTDAILEVILAEYEQGSSIPTISRGLVSYFDDNRAVADRLARTVTNDVYNRAHIERYEDSGVVDGVQFSAHMDDRTSEICEMLNGTIWALGDPEIQAPPLHFNCFVEGTRIEPTSDLVAAFRARYSGQVVELTLSDGRRLTVTPNHMLLTPNGFLAAKFLRDGDDVVCRPLLKRVVHGIDPNQNNMHPTVEEVFGTFGISRGVRSKTMPATSADFHNDGEFVEGNIDVVTSKGFLLSAAYTKFFEHIYKYCLGTGNSDLVNLPIDSDLFSVLISLAFAADGGMSGGRKTSPFFDGRLMHPDIHSFAAVARSDPDLVESRDNYTTSHPKLPSDCLDRHPPHIQPPESVEVNGLTFGCLEPHISKPSVDSCSTDLEMIRNLLTRHSRIIAVQKVVSIDVVPFHGYIYDFQTLSTLCLGNGVVTSNCRSRLVPYFGKIPGDRDFTKEFGSEFVAGATATATTFRGKYWRSMAAAADSVKHDALLQELATVRDLVVDRCPVKPHHEPTVDDAYSAICQGS